jgi:teichuronic acid biosynthesis glycosyltransferase TuaG
MKAGLNDATCISVIMPAWNAAQTIRESIASVLAQDDEGWELLIVDDGSDDATAAIASAAASSDARIRLLSHPVSHGPAAARNTAIEVAQGRYIAFLDADDLWLPGKLSCQRTAMEASGAAVVAGGYRRMNEDGSLVGRLILPPERITLRRAKWSNPIGMLTAIIDRERSGRIHFEKMYHEDHVLWLELLRAGNPMVGVHVDMGRYRLGPGSISANKIRNCPAAWKAMRTSHRTSVGMVPSFAWYMLRGVYMAMRFRPRLNRSTKI